MKSYLFFQFYYYGFVWVFVACRGDKLVGWGRIVRLSSGSVPPYPFRPCAPPCGGFRPLRSRAHFGQSPLRLDPLSAGRFAGPPWLRAAPPPSPADVSA